MGTRDYNFLTGPQTEDLPAASAPVGDDDIVRKQDLDGHTADTAGAHAATAILNAPTGNLAGTTVQAALDELQSDVDTRALDSALTSHLSDTSTHGVGVILGSTETQDVSAKTFTDAVQLTEIATPATPSAGKMKVYPKSDGLLYKMGPSGVESEVGSGGGGSGGINYASGNDSDFNGALGSGWSVYDDAAAAPVDGGGGTSALTMARTTTTPLRGAGSALITPSTNIGEGAAFGFTIERADFATMFEVKFAYEINTYASFTDGDIGVWAISASDSGFTTNVEVVQLAPYKISKASGQETFKGVFQTHASNTFYRICIHQITANTGYTLEIDDFSVGPQSGGAMGAAVTDWDTTWVPTSTWLTNATHTGARRRVGDVGEFQAKIALTGAPTSAGLVINLPAGVTMDSAKIMGATGTVVLGTGQATDAATEQHPLFVTYESTTSVRVNVTKITGTYLVNSPTVTQAIPFTFGSGDSVTVSFRAPILGWSSSTVMSSDSGTRQISVQAKAGTTAITNAGYTTVIFSSEDRDTASIYSTTTGLATVTEAGDYDVDSALFGATATWAAGSYVDVGVAIDGTLVQVVRSYMYSTGAVELAGKFAGSVYATAGQTISIQAKQTGAASLALDGNAARNFLTIKKKASPQQIAASEKIYARASNSTQALTSTPTAVVFATKDDDSHDCLTLATGAFVAPRAGRVKVATYLLGPGSNWTATGEGFLAYAYKNGSVYARIGGANVAGAVTGRRLQASGYTYVKVNAGDSVVLRASNDIAGSIPAGADLAWVTYEME